MDIRELFYALTTVVGLLLIVLTLHRLLNGWWRKFPLLTFLLTLYLFSIVPPIASYVNNGNWTLPGAQRLYWILSIGSQITIFLLILQLMLQIGKQVEKRKPFFRAVVCAVLALVVVSVAYHFDEKTNRLLSLVSRDLTFLVTLLNAAIWRDVIQLRKRDPLLLTIFAGIGFQCAGEAAGHSIRILGGKGMHEFGDAMMALTSILTLGIWHAGFSRASKIRARKPRAAVSDRTDNQEEGRGGAEMPRAISIETP